MTPVGALLLFDIGSDIFSRPEVGNLPIPSNILFNLFNFAVMITVVGVGIHSTSTSVYQSFKKKGKFQKEAFKTNELFHGPWSHNLTYVGSIVSILLLGLLELNHPYFGRTINFNLLIFSGILLGIIGTIIILRGTYLTLPLITAFIGTVLVGHSVRNFAFNIYSYPMTIVSVAALLTIFTLLMLSSIIFALSETLSKRVVHRTFPKGHRFHEGIDLKVLMVRIEQNFVTRRKR
jgi:hypothetical protein